MALFRYSYREEREACQEIYGVKNHFPTHQWMEMFRQYQSSRFRPTVAPSLNVWCWKWNMSCLWFNIVGYIFWQQLKEEVLLLDALITIDDYLFRSWRSFKTTNLHMQPIQCCTAAVFPCGLWTKCHASSIVGLLAKLKWKVDYSKNHETKNRKEIYHQISWFFPSLLTWAQPLASHSQPFCSLFLSIP